MLEVPSVVKLWVAPLPLIGAVVPVGSVTEPEPVVVVTVVTVGVGSVEKFPLPIATTPVL